MTELLFPREDGHPVVTWVLKLAAFTVAEHIVF